MAIDQNLSPPTPESTQAAAIENELPAYRAISAQAVLSLILGVLSILSIANQFFLVCAILAIVFGALATRKIQRYPDMLTGKSFAQAGIGLGLVFGLGSFTAETVQHYLRTSGAARFAKQYVEVLKSGNIDAAYWFKQPPARRKSKSPEELMKEARGSAPHPEMFDQMEMGTVNVIKRRLNSAPGQEIHFSKIESDGLEGLDSYATALVELHGPTSKEFAQEEQFALLVLKGQSEKGKLEWWIEDVRFPYTPSSYTPAPKPVDDGHGHAH